MLVPQYALVSGHNGECSENGMQRRRLAITTTVTADAKIQTEPS